MREEGRRGESMIGRTDRSRKGTWEKRQKEINYEEDIGKGSNGKKAKLSL
jgi:hypothetical protein